MLRSVIALFVAAGCLSPAYSQITSGEILVVDQSGDTVYRVDPQGGAFQAVLGPANGLNAPGSVGFTRLGNLLVANTGNSELIELGNNLVVSVVLDASDGLSGISGANGIAIDGRGRVHLGNSQQKELLRFNEDYTGGLVLADAADGVNFADGIAFLADGDMLVAMRNCGGQILHVTSSGSTTLFDTLLGENPLSTAIRDNRDVYVLNDNGNLYRYAGGLAGNRSLLATFPGGLGGLAFSPDFNVLYHVNQTDGAVRRVDPDTGASNILVNQGWDAVSVAVANGQHAPGTFVEFGQGLAGSGGFLPTMRGAGSPRIGNALSIELRDFLGDARSFLLIGQDLTEQPLAGGTVYIDLNTFTLLNPLRLPGAPLTPGAGDVDLFFTVPNTNLLVYSNWYLQHFALDVLAPEGVSMSNPVRVYIGE